MKNAVAAICLLGMLTMSCTTVDLNYGARTTGLVAVIPFKLYGSMIVAELAVDGSDPLAFVFDTGAGGTVISARTATRLGITGEKAVSREGATGAAQIVLSTKHTVSAGDFKLRGVTLGIAELDHIDRRLGMRIEGIIGWAILSRYAVRLDYDSMLIEIFDAKRFDYSLDAQGYNIEVSGTAIFINVAVGFQSGATFTEKVLVDTGSGGNISFNTPFSRENELLTEMGGGYERQIQSLSTESSRIYTGMLPRLSIGQHEFVNVPATIAFAETGALSWPGVMGILGNGILKRFNMFIDLQQQRIFLEPNQLYHEMFETNCSGLELVMDDTLHKVIVDHVYISSPADQSGLKVGDEIVQIDGDRASSLQLPQIRSTLSQDEKEVEILIDRKGESHSYVLRLRPPIMWGS